MASGSLLRNTILRHLGHECGRPNTHASLFGNRGRLGRVEQVDADRGETVYSRKILSFDLFWFKGLTVRVAQR